MAIAPLTINSERDAVADFTKPFMSLGCMDSELRDSNKRQDLFLNESLLPLKCRTDLPQPKTNRPTFFHRHKMKDDFYSLVPRSAKLREDSCC